MKENLYIKKDFNEELTREKLRDYQLILEYKSLSLYSPQGVYTLPSLSSNLTWHGVIFVRQGYYKEGVFRFKIEIPHNYPNARPAVFFLNYLYHPLVHPQTGELSMGPQFPVLVPEKDFIFSVLAYIRKVFYFRDFWTVSKFALNEEALFNYTQDEEVFCEEVNKCVLEKQENPSGNFMKFTEFNAFHNKVLKVLRSNSNDEKGCEHFMKWFRRTFNGNF